MSDNFEIAHKYPLGWKHQTLRIMLTVNLSHFSLRVHAYTIWNHVFKTHVFKHMFLNTCFLNTCFFKYMFLKHVLKTQSNKQTNKQTKQNKQKQKKPKEKKKTLSYVFLYAHTRWCFTLHFGVFQISLAAVQHERGPRTSTLRKHMVLFLRDSTVPEMVTQPPTNMKYVPQMSPIPFCGCGPNAVTDELHTRLAGRNPVEFKCGHGVTNCSRPNDMRGSSTCLRVRGLIYCK